MRKWFKQYLSSYHALERIKMMSLPGWRNFMHKMHILFVIIENPAVTGIATACNCGTQTDIFKHFKICRYLIFFFLLKRNWRKCFKISNTEIHVNFSKSFYSNCYADKSWVSFFFFFLLEAFHPTVYTLMFFIFD